MSRPLPCFCQRGGFCFWRLIAVILNYYREGTTPNYILRISYSPVNSVVVSTSQHRKPSDHQHDSTKVKNLLTSALQAVTSNKEQSWCTRFYFMAIFFFYLLFMFSWSCYIVLFSIYGSHLPICYLAYNKILLLNHLHWAGHVTRQDNHRIPRFVLLAPLEMVPVQSVAQNSDSRLFWNVSSETSKFTKLGELGRRMIEPRGDLLYTMELNLTRIVPTWSRELGKDEDVGVPLSFTTEYCKSTSKDKAVRNSPHIVWSCTLSIVV